MRKPVGKRLLPPATVGALPLDSTPAGLPPARTAASLAAAFAPRSNSCTSPSLALRFHWLTWLGCTPCFPAI